MTPPGTTISNVATLSHTNFSGQVETTPSNVVDIVTTIARTDASLSFIQLVSGVGTDSLTIGVTECAAGGGAFAPLPDPVLFDGTPVDPNATVSVIDASLYHQGEPIFLRLTDLDQNLDPAVVETVDVIVTSPGFGDSETVRLSETDPNSGVFTGYIASGAGPATPGDCVLQVATGGTVEASYIDPQDAMDTEVTSILVDPFGIVFDSRTGQAIDGAQVTLIDESTGQPAMVFGDDGTSTFPSTLTSGGSVQDSSGNTYNFGPGGFRFPVVAPGDYRLVIVAPAGYSDGSTASIATLQTLPNAPFALSAGSFGNPFSVDPGPAFELDVPLDPIATALFLQKQALNEIAAAGDFVGYALTLENTTLSMATNVVMTDVLPAGFRYMSGSTRIDGTLGPDPVISNDGRTLSFVLGNLPSATPVNIRYVTEVTVGVRGEEAINEAQAIADGLTSNTARAMVRITEDFFAQSFILGRVVLGECDDDLTNDLDGVAGIRMVMEDGRYAVTDEDGHYHFEGISPGTHVVQLDVDSVPDSLELSPCKSSRFAGRPFSRFVDLEAGMLWRANFYLREVAPPNGRVSLALSSQIIGKSVDYTLSLTGQTVAVVQFKSMVMLPDGMDYIAGSATVGGTRSPDPEIQGNVLTFRLDDSDPNWARTIRFRARLPNRAGEYVTKAIATFSTGEAANERTPTAENVLVRGESEYEFSEYSLTTHFDTLSAELTQIDRQQIDQLIEQWQSAKDVRMRSIGHTDSRGISAASRHIFADNYELSLARAASVAKYIRERLSLGLDQIDAEGHGPDEPVASNANPEGRAENRRVQLQVWVERQGKAAPLALKKDDSGEQWVTTKGLTAARQAPDSMQGGTKQVTDDTNALYQDTNWLEIAEPNAEWFLPKRDYNPAIPSLKVAIKHKPEQTVDLQLNGEPVSPLNFEGVTTNGGQTVALSRWRGVDLGDGDNQLVAVVREGDNVVNRLERSVHYSGGPAYGFLVPEKSNLIADGKTRPVVAIRVFDQTGYAARPNTIGNFSVDPPYRSWWEVESLQEEQLLAPHHRQPIYSVDADGIARIELEPTLLTGEVVLRLYFPQPQELGGPLETDIRVWLKPAPRDWILVGMAEGTVGYNTISKNMQAAQDAGVEDEFYEDGRLAFYAKGRIRGEFLLTLAYDSDKDDENADRLHDVIEPDRYYTIYGDTSEQRFDAASQEKLYLKIERNQFYAMFGDYDTGLNVTELSRYSRTLNGLKSEYRGQRFAYSVFASETNLSFIKDELRGDGTSGLYQLNSTPIVINSDKISIEVRDRFRPEVILEVRVLTRFLDYSIDYLKGTVFFKEPIPSRDQNMNPVFIVADYEVRDGGDETITGGGRAEMLFADGRVQLGVSAIHEGSNQGDGDLGGVDMLYALGERTALQAEYAQTAVDEQIGDREGDAYLIELEHNGPRVQGQAYVIEQAQGFGLGQQRGTDMATRRVGVDGRVNVTEQISVNAEAFHQDNLAVDTQRDVMAAEVQYNQLDQYGALGLRYVRDEDAMGQPMESQQAYISGNKRVWDGRITLRGTADVNLGGKDGSIDYPTRLLLGGDYNFSDSVAFFAEQEFTNGAEIESQMTRIGVKASPWNQTQFNGGVNQQLTEFGLRTFMNLGLIQGFQLNERWALDFGVDQSNTLRGMNAEPLNPDVPLASGSVTEDFTAGFVGGTYRSTDWSWTSRMEMRDSDTENRFGLLTGLYRENQQGHGFSLNAQIFGSDSQVFGDMIDADVRVGWAHRPVASEWIVLDRLEVIYDGRDDGQMEVESWRVVNNMNISWMPSQHVQFGVQYGAKYVRSNFDNDAFTGFTDLIGFDMRRDINETWDWGLHTNLRHSWNSNVYDYGLGLDVGYSFATNTWVSLGYNFVGFDDDDFSRSRYVAQGPYLRLRFKADQATFRQLLGAD